MIADQVPCVFLITEIIDAMALAMQGSTHSGRGTEQLTAKIDSTLCINPAQSRMLSVPVHRPNGTMQVKVPRSMEI